MATIDEILREHHPALQNIAVTMRCHLVGEWHSGLGVPLPRGTVGIYSCQGRLWGQHVRDDILRFLSTRDPGLEPEIGALKLVGNVEDLGNDVVGLTGILALAPDIISDAVGMPPLQRVDASVVSTPLVREAGSTRDSLTAWTTEITPLFDEAADRDAWIEYWFEGTKDGQLLTDLGVVTRDLEVFDDESLFDVTRAGIQLWVGTPAEREGVFLHADETHESPVWELAHWSWDEDTADDDPEDWAAEFDHHEPAKLLSLPVSPIGPPAADIAQRLLGALYVIESRPDPSNRMVYKFAAAYLTWSAVIDDPAGMIEAVRRLRVFASVVVPGNFAVAMARFADSANLTPELVAQMDALLVDWPAGRRAAE